MTHSPNLMDQKSFRGSDPWDRCPDQLIHSSTLMTVCVCVVVVVVIEAAVVLRLRPHCDVITGSGGLIVCSSKQKHRSVLGSRSF